MIKILNFMLYNYISMKKSSNAFLNTKWEKKIRDIIYKCENCSTFMELDINRCKLELDNIIGLLENLLKYSNGKAEENEEI